MRLNEVPYKDKEAPPRCETKPLLHLVPIIARIMNEWNLEIPPPCKKNGN